MPQGHGYYEDTLTLANNKINTAIRSMKQKRFPLDLLLFDMCIPLKLTS